MPIPDSFPIPPGWTSPDPVVAGSTPIRAVHINEIRANINAIPTKPQIEALISSFSSAQYFVSQGWTIGVYHQTTGISDYLMDFDILGISIGFTGITGGSSFNNSLVIDSNYWPNISRRLFQLFQTSGASENEARYRICVFGIKPISEGAPNNPDLLSNGLLHQDIYGYDHEGKAYYQNVWYDMKNNIWNGAGN